MARNSDTIAAAFGRLALTFKLTVVICASGLMSFSNLFAAPPGWKMTWNDEFEGTTLDTSKWDPIYWLQPFNNEQQSYTPSRVSVSGGNLVLTADDTSLTQSNQPYTSGKVESKYVQKYGRWEIRAKLPGTKGTWPAIWLLPDTNQYPWPSQGEIDIMENRGHQSHLTSSAFHWGPNYEGREFLAEEQQTTSGGNPDNYHGEFHTYAVEWDATKIRFFVDDVHYHTVSNEDTKNDLFPNGFLSTQTAPMEVNLNVAVGGSFLAAEQQPDASSTWPQEMLVDFVRVYQRAESPPPVVFKNGSFEEQGGSLTGWTTFGNLIPNVQTAHEATPADGNETLKLFGQFNNELNYSGIEQGISVSPGDDISATLSALVRAADDLVGANRVEMKLDYYSEFGAKYGSTGYLGSSPSTVIASATTANDSWTVHQIVGTAPAQAVEARLAVVFIQPENDGGAIHIDNVSFENLDLDFNADANDDGKVSGVDFLHWQRGLDKNDGTAVSDGDFNYDGVVDENDIDVWSTQFGSFATSARSRIVPEPTPSMLVIVAALSLVDSRWFFLFSILN